MNSTHQRESDDSAFFYGESSEGSYENYRNKNLPEGYTAYKEIGRLCELVYDRYSSVYSDDSMQGKRPNSFTGKRFYFKIGWVSIFKVS